MTVVLPGYDAWKTEPSARGGDEECPECGEFTLEVDHADRSAECLSEGCDYSAGFDWDAEAERRMEVDW